MAGGGREEGREREKRGKKNLFATVRVNKYTRRAPEADVSSALWKFGTAERKGRG